MSLQRGANVRGWEGVTRGLAKSDEEYSASMFSMVGLVAAIVLTALLAVLLARSNTPVHANAIMLLGFLIIAMMLLRSHYLRATGQVAGRTARSKTAAKPASRPAPAPKAAPAAASKPEPAPEPVAAEATDASEDVGQRPAALDGPRDGTGDDLTLIKGVGPKLAKLCNSLGFYHFDQIAAWSADEVAWVDQNLEGFKGRVSRDGWVSQAKILASGGETEFSSRQ